MIQITTVYFYSFTSTCQDYYHPLLAPVTFCKDPDAQDAKCEVSL